MTLEADSGAFAEEFSRLDLPLAVLDLQTLRIRAVTDGLVGPRGLFVQDIVGRPYLDLVVADERPSAELVLKALATGSIDFARTRRHLLTEPGREARTIWAAVVEIGEERVAILQLSAADSSLASPLGAFLGSNQVELTIGRVDENWRISLVSSGVEDLLGIAAEEMVGKLLLGTVTQPDATRVLRAASSARDGLSVGLSVRMRSAAGWLEVALVLGGLAGSTDRMFILGPIQVVPDPARRKLEQHLRRIGAEVFASGVLEATVSTPAIAEIASAAQLTPRQWDILTRLVRGERVPTIARELFLSQSTVRNHLSRIYTRLGVGSQAELIELAHSGGGFTA